MIITDLDLFYDDIFVTELVQHVFNVSCYAWMNTKCYDTVVSILSYKMKKK